MAFIHRPEYYTHSSEDAEGNDIRGLAEFIIAKHRSGQVGTVKMRFTSQFVRFENWDDGRRVVQTQTVQSRMNDEDDSGPTTRSPLSGGLASANPFEGSPMPDIMPGPGESVPF